MSERNQDLPLSDDVDNESSAEYARREIPMSDLPLAPDDAGVHSPELSDLNTPGEIDIEDLDEDAVSDALPPDARLDPLEE
jgi:hypothetical protein